MSTLPDELDRDRSRSVHNPGGSQVPLSDDVGRERRRYERHGGDHVARYRWVAGQVRGHRVLDVGCGHGFGALFLAGAAREYHGIDVDSDAVSWAARKISPVVPRSRFEETAVVPSDGSFDAVVCFEVVEHVADPVRLLRSLRAAVCPGGRVFLSTPNGAHSIGRPGWFMSPFHLAEFTAQELDRMLAPVFPEGGEFFAQSRYDGLDWWPQVLRLKLVASRPRGSLGPGATDGETPRSARRAHAWFRRVPSPAGLWKLRRLGSPLRDGLRYSHLVWAGRRAPDSAGAR